MRRKTISMLVASVALGMAILPSPVSAAMRGGSGGMGMHGGMAGGFRGGMSAGPGFRGGMSTGPNFRQGFAVRDNFAFRNRAFINNRVALRNHVFINNRFAFRHHRFHRFARPFFVASVGDDCFIVRHVWTPWGWRWRRVWVCG